MKVPRNEFYYYYEGNLCAVRKDDWKLVLPHKYRSYEGVRTWKGWLARTVCSAENQDLNFII